jgi:UDPglucose 6-dehydrogenase
MSRKYNIGIVGNGFVGSAVAYGFSPQCGYDANIRIYDKQQEKSNSSLEEAVNESDFIFLSVPTPSNQDGSIHLGVIETALAEINEAKVDTRKKNVVLIRSTVVPGTTRKLAKKYPRLNLVFNPEFLTERSAKFDFINQSRFIIGGLTNTPEIPRWEVSAVARLFRHRFGDSTPVVMCDYETAEIIKYMNNCFFALKVSFLNEMKMLADKSGVDWNIAVDGFVRDGRVGHSHLQVPGPDGKLGFGGSCFPKDLRAIIQFGEESEVDMKTLKAAWETNLEVRPEKDWEELKGRAVIE